MSAGENVLGAALAAGIPLPHSCRAGRCATCKARLLSGEIAYPDGKLPPGIVASEAARGEVLLCQARPRSELFIETRRRSSQVSEWVEARLIAIEPLPLRALRVRLAVAAGTFVTRPGQFAELRDAAGNAARLAVIAAADEVIELEAGDDGSALRDWLDNSAATGTVLDLQGPFDRPG